VGLFASNIANSRKRTAARAMFPELAEVLQTPRMIGLRLRAEW